MTKAQHPEKKTIGRLEKVDFPLWGLQQLDAKIDTGAYTSSLHCHHILLTEENRNVSFFLLDPTHPEYEDRKFTCPVADIKRIRSSNGLVEERIIISGRIRISEEEYPIRLSLTDRSEMRYPLLLGRKFITKKFIVDVSGTYLGNKD